MAAGEAIVRSLAHMTGALPATIDRATREAQKAGLAPIGRKGGGKGAAHWQYPHLVNLGIIAALATIGMPMTKAGGTVPLFRALGPFQYDNSQEGPPALWLAEHRAWLVAMGIADSAKTGETHLPGNTLGEVLDDVVNRCGQVDGETLRQLLRDEHLRIILGFKGRTPWARMSLFEAGTGKFYSTAFTPKQFKFAELLVPVPGLHGNFEPSVTMTFPLINALADLWADSLAQSRVSPGLVRSLAA